MGFIYGDDHWDEHPKFLAAFAVDPWAIVLWWAGMAYCRRNATGGLIPAIKVRQLMGWRPKAERALYEVVLWERLADGGAAVHDYADWNRTAEERSASARNAAQVRWAKDRARRASADAGA